MHLDNAIDQLYQKYTMVTEKTPEILSQKNLHDSMSALPFMAKVRIRGDLQLLTGQPQRMDATVEGYISYAGGYLYISHAPDPKLLRQHGLMSDYFSATYVSPVVHVNIHGWSKVVNVREIVLLESFDPFTGKEPMKFNDKRFLFWNGAPYSGHLGGGAVETLSLNKTINGCHFEMVSGTRAITITLPNKSKVWINTTTVLPKRLGDMISDCGSLGLMGNNTWLTYGVAANWVQKIIIFYLLYNLEYWLSNNTFLLFTGYLPSKYTKPTRQHGATLPTVNEILEQIASLGGVLQPLNHPRYDNGGLIDDKIVNLPSKRQHYLFLVNLNGLYHYYKSKEFQELNLIDLHSI